MASPRQPSAKTMKSIFDLLLCAPSYPTEIQNKTGLQGNTVNGALRFLLQKKLVLRKRRGQRVLYSLAKPDEEWYKPWIKLVKQKERAPKPVKVEKQMSNALLRKALDRQVSNLRERFGKLIEGPLNDELIDTLIKLQKDTSLKLLLSTMEKPFCLECLNNTKSYFPMFLIQDSNELCCPNCGITIQRLSTETDRPTQNSEEIKRRELFYNGDERKKLSYTEIERLLTKYEKGTPKKRKLRKA
jgi:DNA-binding transcriptional ArsR family regulator